MPPAPPALRIRRLLFPAVCYLGLFVAAWWRTDCVLGWLVFGLAPVLWLDRFVFRCLPWLSPAEWRSGLIIRGVYLVAGTAVIWSIFHSVIYFSEALFSGLILTLAAFLLETVVGALGAPPPEGGTPRNARLRIALVAVALVPPALLIVPLYNVHPIHTRPRHTPAEVGIPYEDVKLHTADGLELPGWLIKHPHPRGSVIYLHGHAGNRGQVFSALQPLSELGLNVLTFDMRGHGESPGYTITFGLKEVLDVMAAEEFMAQQFPDQPLYLMGTSYGASVAIQALPRMKHVQAAWVESGFSRLSEVARGTFFWAPDKALDAVVWGYSSLIWLDSGFWGLDANPIDCLEGTRVPICFCHGDKDRFVTFEQGQAMYEAYRGPKSHYWIENAAHGDMHYQGGEEYSRRLMSFFNDCLPKPGKETTGEVGNQRNAGSRHGYRE